MRAVSSLLLSLALVPVCVVQTAVTAQYENLPGVALYSNGYLLSWDSPQYTQVTVYGRDAKPAFSAPEQTGDSSDVMWSVDSDGVVAGAYWARHPMEVRIYLLDLSGKVTSTISTGSYIPQQIVFAPDHTIWTAGFIAGNDGTHDFNVLHHYARTGEELGQALSWSAIGGDLKRPVIEGIRGGQLLYIANDRIGWNATLHYGSRTWIEVSFSGVLLGKYDLKTPDGLSLMTVAMTASGNAYAGIISKIHSAVRFAVLDRSKGVWQKVVGDPGGVLIGSEGDSLVFSNLDGARTTLKFAPSASLRVEEPQQ
jgi:hypothetical protein